MAYRPSAPRVNAGLITAGASAAAHASRFARTATSNRTRISCGLSVTCWQRPAAAIARGTTDHGMRQSSGYRNGLAIAGLIAALALVVKGLQDLPRGWPLLMVAVVLVAALALRRFMFRD